MTDPDKRDSVPAETQSVPAQREGADQQSMPAEPEAPEPLRMQPRVLRLAMDVSVSESVSSPVGTLCSGRPQ